jgi:hypothetical protein
LDIFLGRSSTLHPIWRPMTINHRVIKDFPA